MTDALDTLARTPVLLIALDFDGTLAPLVDVPLEARMVAKAREAIDELRAMDDTYVALVSGRMLMDLQIVSEHDPSSGIFLAGSHGAQFLLPDGWTALPQPEPSDAVREHADAVRNSLANLPGVWVEQKPYGFVVHTRMADDEMTADVEARINAYAATHLATWRQRGGHDIVEFSERQEGKDSAIRALRTAVGATAVLFAGDDETDEDALASLQPPDLGVRVGDGPTVAQIRLQSADEVAETLLSLASARRAAGFSDASNSSTS